MISEVNNRKQLNSQLKPPTAKIASITNTGLVTIEFSENLLIPKNFKNMKQKLSECLIIITYYTNVHILH